MLFVQMTSTLHQSIILLQVWFSEEHQSGRWWTGHVLGVRHSDTQDPWEQLYVEFGKVRDGTQVTTHKRKPTPPVTDIQQSSAERMQPTQLRPSWSGQ